MPVSLDVHIDGLDHLQAALKGMPAALRLEQRKAVQRALTVVQEEIARRIHSPRGHAAKGIKQKITGSGINIKGRLAPGGRGALAAVFSQRTRRPGQTPPPVKGIRTWARMHGINPYALAKSIGQKGTVGHPVTRPAWEAKRHQVIELFRDGLLAVARMVKR